MAKNDANTVDNVEQTATETTVEGSERPFSEQVREFQLLFAYELHRMADLANACSTFDSIANDIGLPARYGMTAEGSMDEYGYSPYSYRGNDILEDIDNEDDAKRWALRVSQGLISATDSYGYRETYDPTADGGNGAYVTIGQFLERFGMPTKVTLSVKVTGTFDVPFDVTGWEDSNLIDNVNVYTVSEHIAGAIHRGDSSVQWKVSKADS